MKKLIFICTLITSFFCSAQPLLNKVVDTKIPELKIVTYNIAAGANNFKVDLNLTAQAIKLMDPDIIALQEVDKNTVRSGHVDQTAVLAKLTGYNAVFGKAIDFDGGEYGIAVLSKHPVKLLDIQPLPSGNEEQRIALYTEVTVPGFPAPITFINTHLDWHENPAIRLSQIYALNEKSLDIRGIKILAGDFNDVDNSATHQQLARYWNAIFPAEMDHRSWPADNPEIGIDYIYTSKAQVWKTHAAVPNKPLETKSVQWNKVSDHLPVVATLKLIEQ